MVSKWMIVNDIRKMLSDEMGQWWTTPGRYKAPYKSRNQIVAELVVDLLIDKGYLQVEEFQNLQSSQFPG